VRIHLLSCPVITLLLWAGGGLASRAAAGGERTIAVLLSHRAEQYSEALTGFEEHLSASGVKFRLEKHYLNGDPAEADRVLTQLSREKHELIFALGTFAARKAAGGVVKAPVVAGMVLKEADLRDVPRRVRGVTLQHPLETQFRYLRKFAPEAREIGIIFDPEENGEIVSRATGIAGKMGLELLGREVRDPREIPAALEELSRKADILWGVADRLVLNPRTAEDILLYSFRQRIPLVGLSPSWVKAGALYSLGWDYRDIGVQCAEISLAVLGGKGGSGSAHSLVPPRKVQYFVNLKTARRMKLKIPESLLAGAQKAF
jgi:putative ABC transport system substrate-binding protein